MALTELQLPTKQTLYGTLQSAANKMNNLMRQWEDLAEFIGFMDSSDLSSLGVPAEVQTNLAKFRTILNEVLAFYKGEGTTQTHVPADIIDLIRSI